MVAYRKIEFLLIVFSIAVSTYAQVPEPRFEALEKGGFRVYIPSQEGVKRFRFNANINEDIHRTKTGSINGEASSPTNGVFLLNFSNKLNVGDVINYRIHVDVGSLGYRRDDLAWTVTKADLKDEYSPLGVICRQSYTTVNGQASCIGADIIAEEFNGQSIDTTKWTIEQYIPTYQGINYEFNSYENIDSTRFIKNGVLFLKPIPLLNDNEVRTVLDLKNGCTSDNATQCYHAHKSSFIIPPVKSARITSKIPFKYGKIEIKAKLPAGDWLFPIIELQMTKEVWGSRSPKVVIAYTRGNDRLTTGAGEDIGSRRLYGGPVLDYMEPGRSSRLKQIQNNAPYTSDFHIYSLNWVPGKMTFAVDDRVFGEVSTQEGFSEFAHISSAPEAPYDREFFMTLGVAAAGLIDFPDGSTSGNVRKPWSNVDRNYVKSFFDRRQEWSSTWSGDNVALQVDYVKVTAV